MTNYLAIARRALGCQQPRNAASVPTKPVESGASDGSRVDLQSEFQRDAWGFPLEPGEQALDPATPCPYCRCLEKWEPVVGHPRCQKCDPPAAALRLLEQVEKIRRERGFAARQSRPMPDQPHCRRCYATQFVDSKIHGGRSVRRDCAHCGHTAGFPVWFGRADERFEQDENGANE